MRGEMEDLYGRAGWRTDKGRQSLGPRLSGVSTAGPRTAGRTPASDVSSFGGGAPPPRSARSPGPTSPDVPDARKEWAPTQGSRAWSRAATAAPGSCTTSTTGPPAYSRGSTGPRPTGPSYVPARRPRRPRAQGSARRATRTRCPQLVGFASRPGPARARRGLGRAARQ